MLPLKKTESQKWGEFLDSVFFLHPISGTLFFWGVARIAVHSVYVPAYTLKYSPAPEPSPPPSCGATTRTVRRCLRRIFHLSNFYTLPSCSPGHAISKNLQRAPVALFLPMLLNFERYNREFYGKQALYKTRRGRPR